jgi:hypothetical protein
VNYSRPLSVLALAALGISLVFTLESPRFIILSPQGDPGHETPYKAPNQVLTWEKGNGAVSRWNAHAPHTRCGTSISFHPHDDTSKRHRVSVLADASTTYNSP